MMELAFSWITFFFIAAFTLKFIKKWKRSNEMNAIKKQQPPGPWKLPFIGHMHHLMGSQLPHHALANLAKRHGDLMQLQLGEISTIVVSSPIMAKQILKTHDLAFADKPQFLAAKIVFYNYSAVGLSPYGDYWRQMRKIYTLELLSSKNVQSLGSIRQDEALQLISSIQTLAGSGKAINLTERVSSYTSSMVCRAALGKEFGKHRNTLEPLLREVVSLMSGFDVSDVFPSRKILHHLSWMRPKLLRLHHKIDRVLDAIIHEHVVNQTRTRTANGEFGLEDLIDVLLRIRESGDFHVPITDENIKAALLDAFVAGSETSTVVVVWAMAEMIRNPNVLAKAQSEIRIALMGKQKVEENVIQELSYLTSVIKETLRLHPPGPLLLPRESREECEIEGYIIPVKTRVMINAWAIGRDPRYWDEPESFKPERFLDNNSADFTGTNYEFLPFGSGRRMCPGILFGLANVKVPLANMLYYFNWKLPDDTMNNTELDMTEAYGLLASRKNNLFLVASRACVNPPDT